MMVIENLMQRKKFDKDLFFVLRSLIGQLTFETTWKIIVNAGAIHPSRYQSVQMYKACFTRMPPYEVNNIAKSPNLSPSDIDSTVIRKLYLAKMGVIYIIFVVGASYKSSDDTMPYYKLQPLTTKATDIGGRWRRSS